MDRYAIAPFVSIVLNGSIELDNHYLRYHADKAQRIKDRGEKCCRTAPEAMDAAIELLEELYLTLHHHTPTQHN